MNLPPVLHNVVSHLIHPTAVKAFLHAADRWDKSALKYRAEAYAIQVDKLLPFTNFALPVALQQVTAGRTF